LLNANVAFLVIPAVSGDPADAGHGPATVAEIASQMSIITSVGSVITSLSLARYHKPREESGQGAALYIERRGLHNLAILYSLPFALLMWSMVTFAAAIMITCFKVQLKSQKAITGAGWLLISMLVGWLIVVSWGDFGVEESDRDEDPPVNGNPALGLGRDSLHPTSWQGIKSWLRRTARRNAGDANENI